MVILAATWQEIQSFFRVTINKQADKDKLYLFDSELYVLSRDPNGPPNMVFTLHERLPV